MLRFGRRHPKNAPSIKLSAILTPAGAAAQLPPHPDAEDYLASVAKQLQMLGNDRYGVCAAVTWANWRLMLSSLLGGASVYPDFSAVEALYRTQNPTFPAEDDGMVLQTLLEDLVRAGGPDGRKPVAFAQVDPKNRDELKAALAIFGCVWLGIDVQQRNMAEFQQGRPWDHHAGDPLVGGHAVLAGGYLGKAISDVRIATWGAETSLTDSFLANNVEEAWVVIDDLNLGSEQFLEGIDLERLALDYLLLTGRSLPLPEPTPTSSLEKHVATFAREIIPWLTSHRHLGVNRDAADSVARFLTVAGMWTPPPR